MMNLAQGKEVSHFHWMLSEIFICTVRFYVVGSKEFGLHVVKLFVKSTFHLLLELNFPPLQKIIIPNLSLLAGQQLSFAVLNYKSKPMLLLEAQVYFCYATQHEQNLPLRLGESELIRKGGILPLNQNLLCSPLKNCDLV